MKERIKERGRKKERIFFTCGSKCICPWQVFIAMTKMAVITARSRGGGVRMGADRVNIPIVIFILLLLLSDLFLSRGLFDLSLLQKMCV